MKGHIPWQLNEEKSWSSVKRPQREKRWDLGPAEQDTFVFTHTWSLWCGWSRCPYETRALGHAPGCRLGLQPPLQRGIAAAEEPQPRGHRSALADHRACGSTHTLYSINMLNLKVCTISFSINSDSFHTLTFRPSPTAQIRAMALGAWWDLHFQQLPFLFTFQLKKHECQLLNRALAVPISSRQLHGCPFCLKTWTFYTFD